VYEQLDQSDKFNTKVLSNLTKLIKPWKDSLNERALSYFAHEVAVELEGALLEEIRLKQVSLLGALILEKMCRQSKSFV